MAERVSSLLAFDKIRETEPCKLFQIATQRTTKDGEIYGSFIAGVMAITLTWNVLMLSLNGISY
jgi:hypothetical protein